VEALSLSLSVEVCSRQTQELSHNATIFNQYEWHPPASSAPSKPHRFASSWAFIFILILQLPVSSLFQIFDLKGPAKKSPYLISQGNAQRNLLSSVVLIENQSTLCITPIYQRCPEIQRLLMSLQMARVDNQQSQLKWRPPKQELDIV
jgi:hypothetical protein